MEGGAPGGALLLVRLMSGTGVAAGTSVGGVVPSEDRVVLVTRLVVPVPERVDSGLSGEEAESRGGVTGSEIDTSESVERPVTVMLLVLMGLLLIVLLVLVSGTVGGALVSRAGPLSVAVSSEAPAVLITSGNTAEPVVLPVPVLTVVETAVPLSDVAGLTKTVFGK